MNLIRIKLTAEAVYAALRGRPAPRKMNDSKINDLYDAWAHYRYKDKTSVEASDLLKKRIWKVVEKKYKDGECLHRLKRNCLKHIGGTAFLEPEEGKFNLSCYELDLYLPFKDSLAMILGHFGVNVRYKCNPEYGHNTVKLELGGWDRWDFDRKWEDWKDIVQDSIAAVAEAIAGDGEPFVITYEKLDDLYVNFDLSPNDVTGGEINLILSENVDINTFLNQVGAFIGRTLNCSGVTERKGDGRWISYSSKTLVLSAFFHESKRHTATVRADADEEKSVKNAGSWAIAYLKGSGMRAKKTFYNVEK